MITVYLRKGEEPANLLKRFKKAVASSGILSIARSKRWFTGKAETRRLERKKAIRRIERKRIKTALKLKLKEMRKKHRKVKK